MCDKAETTKTMMERTCPCLFRQMKFLDFDPTSKVPLEETICDFIKELEALSVFVPVGLSECMIYAFFLIEKGFSSSVFVHSATAKR